MQESERIDSAVGGCVVLHLRDGTFVAGQIGALVSFEHFVTDRGGQFVIARAEPRASAS